MQLFFIRKTSPTQMEDARGVVPFCVQVNSNDVVPVDGESELHTKLREKVQKLTGPVTWLFCEMVEMKARNNDHGDFFWEDTQLSISNLRNGRNGVVRLAYSNNETLHGELTVTVSVNEGSGPGAAVQGKPHIFKKMLEEELGSDVLIVSANGNQLKAHKGVLMAHSPVFQTMFQADMKEAKTQTVEMPDLSEDSVRALLAYMYYGERAEPNAKSLVAFEMLYAGHKYGIPALQTAMKKLLLAKSTQWYDVDVALKLFIFAKKLPEDGDRLKMKAIATLKMNFGNFKNSPTYANLFMEDPQSAMELCEYAFGFAT